MFPANTLEILKKLDKNELKRFGEFLKVPYLNSIGKLNDLYEEAMKAYPGFSERNLNEEKILKKIYKSKEITGGAVKNLYSEFGKALRKFLAYEEFSRNDNAMNLSLVKSLSGKQLYENSNKIIEHTLGKMKHRPLIPDQYLYLFQLENLLTDNMPKMKNLKIQDYYDANFSAAQNLLNHFLCNFFVLSSSISFISKFTNIEVKKPEPEEFIKMFNKKSLLDYIDSSDNPYSSALKLNYLLHYFGIYKCTENDYYAIKRTLEENINDLSEYDLLNFWELLENLVIMKLIPKDRKFWNELFDLNVFFCSRKIYSHTVEPFINFSYTLLRNIITAALMCMEYEWAENFLNEYVNYIGPNLKENEYNYNKGIISFKNKNYGKSLDHLSKVEFTDIYENLNIRFYILMNCIELKHYESASSAIKTIRQFHRTNKDIPEFAERLVSDSLKYFSKIVKAEEENIKIDYSVYKEASRPVRYYHKGYILNKIKKFLVKTS